MAEKVDQLNESESADFSEDEEEDVFSAEEIKIEEMAIDGICGVY